MKHSDSSPVRLGALILGVGGLLAYGLHRASANASAIAILKCTVTLAFIAISQADHRVELEAG